MRTADTEVDATETVLIGGWQISEELRKSCDHSQTNLNCFCCFIHEALGHRAYARTKENEAVSSAAIRRLFQTTVR